MRKKDKFTLILFPIILGMLIWQIPPSKGFNTGDSAVWGADFDAPFIIISSMNALILGQTTSKVIVQAKVQIPFAGSVGSTEAISKVDHQGGFPLRAAGGCWGLWINPQSVSENPTLVINNNIIGLPSLEGDLSITNEGPFTFCVEAGRLLISGIAYDIWLFIGEGFDLCYDAATGILLRMVIPVSESSMMVSISLKQFTIFTPSSSKSGDLFTVGVLVVSIGALVLMRVFLRRKLNLHNNKKALVRRKKSSS